MHDVGHQDDRRASMRDFFWAKISPSVEQLANNLIFSINVFSFLSLIQI